MQFEVQAGAVLSGTIRVPGDKSISHRAAMLGALATGRTEVRGFLAGEDTLHTMRAFVQMGVQVTQADPQTLLIQGVGLDGLHAPPAAIDCGNAGTGMRLLAGLLSGQRFASCLIGDDSLSRRPMRRVLDPLRLMGADIRASDAGTAPLHVSPVPQLRAIHYNSPVASAQVKSCVLLAGLYADGCTSVTEPAITRDHSERMLRTFGADVQVQGCTASIQPRPVLQAQQVVVPSDFSSAAFFLTAAAMTAGSELRLLGVGMNPRRTGLLDCLLDMGAEIHIDNPRTEGGEPVADLHVRGRQLHGIVVPAARVPDMIDEFPMLFVAAACAEGETSVSGAEELRVKESDRLGTMAHGLRSLGVIVEESADGALIRGGRIRGGHIHAHGDHRIAMSFAMAALRAEGSITIADCANVATSFPGFAELAAQCGLRISVRG
jgi:3-phosphoshikimate 1-carboxyvinyltransferase